MEVMTTLSLLVTWGIWIVRNNFVFNDKLCTPTITASMACGIAQALPQHIRVANQREVLTLDIDRTSPWGFFNGASHNNHCRGGVRFYFGWKSLFWTGSRVGWGKQQFWWAPKFKITPHFCSREGVQNIKVFGDSLNVINWTKRIQTCRDLRLQNILISIWDVMEPFDLISCKHVYRENNCQADSASKEGL